jgi:hypothetical protein
MIRLVIDKQGVLNIEQWATPPIVYLDHWALRRFSEDDKLACRFATGLRVRGGTLALSWLNLAEFGNVTSGQQAREAESFLDSNLPRVFFMEVEPFTVIGREDALLAGLAGAPPPADLDLLKAFAQLRPPSSHPLGAHDLFTIMQNPRMARGLEGLGDKVAGRISSLRDEHGTNPAFRSAVARLPALQKVQKATRFLLPELVRTLLIDGRTKVTRNHAIDLMHAVAPVAYCDLVLLDKHWETQVERVRLRLRTAGIAAPLAKVFSGKAKGIDQFLYELAGDAEVAS